MAWGQIAAGFAVAFATTMSGTQAQQVEGGPPILHVEDCGKTAVFECEYSGQRIGGLPQRMRVRHGRYVYSGYDQPTRDRERLWNDP
jgi:hypothetical protein